MQYQLVLQFKGDSLDDYDKMISLEDVLFDELDGSAEVDGHDMGSGETNIFLLTPDQTAALRKVRTVLDRLGLLNDATIAYREIDGEEYTVLWPERYDRIFVVR